MDNTLVLARVAGVFLLVAAAAILLRRQWFMNAVAGFARAGLVRILYAMLELLAGLFLIVLHNDWSSLAAGIISALGWLMAVEGAVLLLLPDVTIARLVAIINRPAWYLCGGIVALFAGGWLVAAGFGFAG